MIIINLPITEEQLIKIIYYGIFIIGGLLFLYHMIKDFRDYKKREPP